MTPAEIKAMLDETGLPVSCGNFPDEPEQPAPAPPFILYAVEADDFYADDENYCAVSQIIVEVYTRTRDFAQETALEAVLRAHDFAWEKSTDYMGKQKLFVATYQMGVIIDADS